MTRVVRSFLLLSAMALMATPAFAQWPVPGVEPARDVPGAKEMPNPNIEHKVVFDVATAGPKPGDVHPMLQATARYLNTLAKMGVPANKRKIAVVFHQGGTDFVLKNDVYKARHDGQDNPNATIIEQLKTAGVDFRLCGQAALGRKIAPTDMLPAVQLDLWALTTIISFQQQGYVLIAP